MMQLLGTIGRIGCDLFGPYTIVERSRSSVDMIGTLVLIVAGLLMVRVYKRRTG